MREFYGNLGATGLLLAAFLLREVARLESLFGNEAEGVFLSQLPLDLRKIAAGGPPHSIAAWRALAAQFPNLFSLRVAA